MVAIILKLNSITVMYIACAAATHVQCKDLRYTLEGGYISVSKPQGSYNNNSFTVGVPTKRHNGTYNGHHTNSILASLMPCLLGQS